MVIVWLSVLPSLRPHLGQGSLTSFERRSILKAEVTAECKLLKKRKVSPSSILLECQLHVRFRTPLSDSDQTTLGLSPLAHQAPIGVAANVVVRC